LLGRRLRLRRSQLALPAGGKIKAQAHHCR
jgi:hypothetical protein